MGDQVGIEVSGKLFYVPLKEFERVRKLSIQPIKKAELFASLSRINTLYMIARAGSGHIGSSFSSMDMMAWLHLNELDLTGSAKESERNLFFSSKGHDAPALYSTLVGMGQLDFNLLHRLRRQDGLPGHPDVRTPGIIANTGSLGMGVSKAKGMVLANRLNKQPVQVYVLTGDGELQEGQFWESLISAANHQLHELIVIVDHNKLQSDTLVDKVSSLGDLEGKLKAFGWHVSRCNGNQMQQFAQTLAAAKQITDKPKIIIADTIKGKGVSLMEHTSIDSDVELYKFHSGAPSEEAYTKAVQELIESVNAQFNAFNQQVPALEEVVRPQTVQMSGQQRLIAAYSKALIEQATQNKNIVAFDADLILDTGLIPFQHAFPDRFVECGIAEQDMVSQAGGMALRGLLPVVHSFSCFLSARPNEQIYTNATEQTKIVYVGSLAGVVPGGPGHSHQAVRDLSTLSAVPGLTLLEPSCEAEVPLVLDWALNQNQQSTYIRLVSLPTLIPFELPKTYQLKKGVGITLQEGRDIAIIAYGPVMLSLACVAAKRLQESAGLHIRVINLPWLNEVNAMWLKQATQDVRHVISMDNHFTIGGQGDRLAAEITALGLANFKLHRLSVGNQVPHHGTNDEVLSAHGLSAESVYQFVTSLDSN